MECWDSGSSSASKIQIQNTRKLCCNGSDIINLDYLPSVPSVARVGGGGFGNGSETVDIDGNTFENV